MFQPGFQLNGNLIYLSLHNSIILTLRLEGLNLHDLKSLLYTPLISICLYMIHSLFSLILHNFSGVIIFNKIPTPPTTTNAAIDEVKDCILR